MRIVDFEGDMDVSSDPSIARLVTLNKLVNLAEY